MTSRIAARASSRLAPIGTSSTMTATSASKSMPKASSAMRIGSRGANESVGAALVDQRIGPETRRHLGAARLAHQLDMVHIGRAVGPLIGARQRRMRVVLVEAGRRHRIGLQRFAPVSRDAARCGASRRAPPAACAPGTRRRCTASGRARRRRVFRRASRPSSVASFMRFPLLMRLWRRFGFLLYA